MIPRVRCANGIVLTAAEAAGGYVATLRAEAHPGPIREFRWSLLYVPPGGANVGSMGDFIAGVARGQQVLLHVPGGVPGTYVVRCVAWNADGPSNPDLDAAAGQQVVEVEDADGIRYPGDEQFGYGAALRSSLNRLRSIGGLDREAEFIASAPDVNLRQVFTLPVPPAPNSNTPCGFSVATFVNGRKCRFACNPNVWEFDVIHPDRIRVGGLARGDKIDVMYGD